MLRNGGTDYSPAPIRLGGPQEDMSKRSMRRCIRRSASHRVVRGTNSSQHSRETDSTGNSQFSVQSSSLIRRSPCGVHTEIIEEPQLPTYGQRNTLPPVRPIYVEGSQTAREATSSDYSIRESHFDDRRKNPNHSVSRRYDSESAHVVDKLLSEHRQIPDTPFFEADRPTIQPPIGLQSLGNTCYMNAALQCILHTPFFLASLSDVIRATPRRDGSSSRTSRLSTPAASALLDLSRDDSRRSQVDLLKIIKNCAAQYNEQFQSDQQNDAHEFIRTFLTVVHDEVNRGKGRNASYEEIREIEEESEPHAFKRWVKHIKVVDDSVVYDHFGGMLRSRSECRKCGHSSFSFDPFLDLTLFLTDNEVYSVGSILLRDYNSDTPEDLRGENRLFCPKCRRKQPSLRSTCVVSWPQNLVLHLNRFRSDGSKDSSKITYPTVFTVVHLKYRLYAVCCHSGTATGGHYTSYVAVEEENVTPKLSRSRFPRSPIMNLQTWFLCNDSNISTVSLTESSSHTTAAYILFYCLIDK